MASQTPVVFILGKPSSSMFTRNSELLKYLFSTGSPGSGKSTLGALLTEKFPAQHISVGNLLRRIKNDGTHPQAEAIATLLNRQELIDAKVLVPILRSKLDESKSLNGATLVILVDGFPRNLAQLEEFEETVSTLANTIALTHYRHATLETNSAGE